MTAPAPAVPAPLDPVLHAKRIAPPEPVALAPVPRDVRADLAAALDGLASDVTTADVLSALRAAVAS